MRTLRHEELKGGYTIGKKIIIDTCEIEQGLFETMAMREQSYFDEDYEELDCVRADSEEKAIADFNEMLLKYAEPLQKSVLGANLEAGKKYTVVSCGDFGFPIAKKITLEDVELTTYAQYSDCVKLTFKPFRKRKSYCQYLYDKSFLIFEGWHDLKDADTKNVIKDNGDVKVTMSKYVCFDSRYIDDLENVFGVPVVCYKDYKKGVDGRLYA